jgi:uncharacterized membrane protein
VDTVLESESDPTTERLAKSLGWVSLGLGIVQLAAPAAVRRLTGVDDSVTAQTLVPLVGARELGHAAGLLRGKSEWVWTRVAGDAMDLTALARALANRSGTRRRRTAIATAAVVGITAVDLYTAYRVLRHSRRGAPMKLHAAITVNRPRDEVYRYWGDLENLPSFMAHLESVRMTGPNRSHWTAKAPAGRTVEWDAEIRMDAPNEMLSWRSLPRADVQNAGVVRFADAPAGQGTEVRVELQYRLPAGRLGAAVAKLLGEHPEQQVRDDLRRFKQVMEVGEVVRSEGSPNGTYARRQVLQRPAQPVH